MVRRVRAIIDDRSSRVVTRATPSPPPRARAARAAQAPRARRDEAPAGRRASRSTICARSRSAGRRRSRSTTPTARPRARSRLRRARQAFQDVEFHPQVLRDVSTVDTSVTVLGGPSALPFGIAPTGFTRLMHTEGERAGAAAAGAAGIPFSLSTLGTTSIEDVARRQPGRPQLVPALHVEGPRSRRRRSSSAPRRRASTRCSSPSTFPSPEPGSATVATA